MTQIAISPKERAHELVELMSTVQVSAVVGLIEAMLDPVSLSVANAPIDDEPVSDEELRDIAESREAYARGDLISNDEVLAEFGLTVQDFDRMGRTPIETALEVEPSHIGK